MNYRKHCAALIVITLVLLHPSSFVFAGDTQLERNSLRGLKGVYIAVEKLRPEIEQAGLTTEQIKKDVESKLRGAGITLLSQEELWAEGSGIPILHVRVYITKLPKPHDRLGYLYALEIALKQEVYLVREPEGTHFADTWGIWRIGHIRGGSDLTLIRTVLQDFLKRFIKAYSSVNLAESTGP